MPKTYINVFTLHKPIQMHRTEKRDLFHNCRQLFTFYYLCQKIPPSALVALVVSAAEVQVLVLRLLQLQLRRHLVGAAEVVRLAVLLLLLDLRFLPAAERATQRDILLPAKRTLLNRSFLALSVSHLLARK